MATKVFVSFRFSDGNEYKKEIVSLLEEKNYSVDVSEDEDRSEFSDDTIQKYLYDKIRESSITVVILTPKAINYQRTNGKIDDWLYDEVSYSLKQYDGKRSNGVIAVYPEKSENLIFSHVDGDKRIIRDLENLTKKNSLNVKDKYKVNPDQNWYNDAEDCYVSFVKYANFKANMQNYLDNAIDKKDHVDHFDIIKEL